MGSCFSWIYKKLKFLCNDVTKEDFETAVEKPGFPFPGDEVTELEINTSPQRTDRSYTMPSLAESDGGRPQFQRQSTSTITVEEKKTPASHFLSEKLFIAFGFIAACLVAGFLRSSNTIGLGYDGFDYIIQHRKPLFDENVRGVEAFHRFPGLTVCSNTINSSACPDGPYSQCNEDPSILALENCQILRYDDNRSGFTPTPCPDWQSISNNTIASALGRYCFTLNTSSENWRAAHRFDRLRLFLRVSETRSDVTPWYGGFVYLHPTSLIETPANVFKLESSRTHFGVGRYHYTAFEVRREFEDDLKAFKNCQNALEEVTYRIFTREAETLAPVNTTEEPDTDFANVSSLSVFSVGFEGSQPALICTFRRNLNGYSEVLEHLAGLLVIPELGALALIWSYFVVYKLIVVAKFKFKCCSQEKEYEKLNAVLCCSFCYAALLFCCMLVVLIVGLLPLQ